MAFYTVLVFLFVLYIYRLVWLAWLWLMVMIMDWLVVSFSSNGKAKIRDERWLLLPAFKFPDWAYDDANNWSTEQMINWLIDWLIDWLTEQHKATERER